MKAILELGFILVMAYVVIQKQLIFHRNIKKIGSMYSESIKILQGRNDPYRTTQVLFSKAGLYDGTDKYDSFEVTEEKTKNDEYEKPKNDFIYYGDEKPKRFILSEDDNEYPEGYIYNDRANP